MAAGALRLRVPKGQNQNGFERMPKATNIESQGSQAIKIEPKWCQNASKGYQTKSMAEKGREKVSKVAERMRRRRKGHRKIKKNTIPKDHQKSIKKNSQNHQDETKREPKASQKGAKVSQGTFKNTTCGTGSKK